MSKAPVSKNDAPEHVVGRTVWDVASEALSIVKLQASLIIIVGLSAFAIFMFYAKGAEQQQETAKRLLEAGALLKDAHDTAGKLRSAQIVDLERQFELTGKAMKRSEEAQSDASKAEASAKEAFFKVAQAQDKVKDAEAKVKEATAKATEAEAKAKEAAAKATEVSAQRDRIQDSLASQTSQLTLTQNDLNRVKGDLSRVKGSVSELADSIRAERWPEVAGKLSNLLMEAYPSFDKQIENALKTLRSLEKLESSPPATPGLDNSLLANPIAPPKIERQLSPTLIAQIQRTLCVEVDGKIGDDDSDTRSALSQFFVGYAHELAPDETRSRGRRGARVVEPIPPPARLSPIELPQRVSPLTPPEAEAEAEPLPYIIDTPERLAAITAAVDKYESCKKHGLKNAFEVGLFFHLGEKRINNALLKAASLAKISVKETGKKLTTAEMRTVVAKLRNAYNLSSGVDDKDADIIDTGLVVSMYEVSQGRQPILPIEPVAPPLSIAKVQLALCVDLTKGAARESTNTAVRSYLLGRGQAVPETIDPTSPALQPSLQAAIEDVGNCATAGFRNGFEVGRFGVPATSSAARITKLQRDLNGILTSVGSPVSVVPTGKLDAQTRLGIAEFRKVSGTLSGDEIDQGLFRLILAQPKP